MSWVAKQKLVRNGNATSVSIPRGFLHQLGWICGRDIVIELTENADALVVRLPRASDFGVPGPPRLDYTPAADKP
jgi:antitoxin component of MazEF toxin-antitoxin module